MKMENEKESKEIRREDGKVFFRHIRYVKDGKVQNMGGATVAYQEIAPGTIKIALSICSKKDNFYKKVGRTISGGRLNSPSQSIIIEMSWDEFTKRIPYEMSQLGNAIW